MQLSVLALDGRGLYVYEDDADKLQVLRMDVIVLLMRDEGVCIVICVFVQSDLSSQSL